MTIPPDPFFKADPWSNATPAALVVEVASNIVDPLSGRGRKLDNSSAPKASHAQSMEGNSAPVAAAVPFAAEGNILDTLPFAADSNELFVWDLLENMAIIRATAMNCGGCVSTS